MYARKQDYVLTCVRTYVYAEAKTHIRAYAQLANQRSRQPKGVAGDHAAGVFNPATPGAVLRSKLDLC